MSAAAVVEAPRERPILFSGPMVRAILAGTKTMTRRVAKPRTVGGALGYWDNLSGRLCDGDDRPTRCPYGAPGDLLWVRETWAPHEHRKDRFYFLASKVSLQDTASQGWDFPETLGVDCPWPSRWRPSIHMPRAASRITLEVTGVRVERLQDITEADARAEIDEVGDAIAKGFALGHWRLFQNAWDAINGQRAPWASNPWVWVVEFRRLP